jgi:hypothetical protein
LNRLGILIRQILWYVRLTMTSGRRIQCNLKTNSV